MKKIKPGKLMAIFMSLLLMFSVIAITPMSVFSYEDEDYYTEEITPEYVDDDEDDTEEELEKYPEYNVEDEEKEVEKPEIEEGPEFEEKPEVEEDAKEEDLEDERPSDELEDMYTLEGYEPWEPLSETIATSTGIPARIMIQQSNYSAAPGSRIFIQAFLFDSYDMQIYGDASIFEDFEFMVSGMANNDSYTASASWATFNVELFIGDSISPRELVATFTFRENLTATAIVVVDPAPQVVTSVELIIVRYADGGWWPIGASAAAVPGEMLAIDATVRDQHGSPIGRAVSFDSISGGIDGDMLIPATSGQHWFLMDLFLSPVETPRNITITVRSDINPAVYDTATISVDIPSISQPYSIQLRWIDGGGWGYFDTTTNNVNKRPGLSFSIDAHAFTQEGYWIANVSNNIVISGGIEGDTFAPQEWSWQIDLSPAQVARTITITATCGTEHNVTRTVTVEVVPATPTYVSFFGVSEKVALGSPAFAMFSILDEYGNSIQGDVPNDFSISVTGSSITDNDWSYSLWSGMWSGEIILWIDYDFEPTPITITVSLGELSESVMIEIVDEVRTVTYVTVNMQRFDEEYNEWVWGDDVEAYPGQSWQIFTQSFDQFGIWMNADIELDLSGGRAGDSIQTIEYEAGLAQWTTTYLVIGTDPTTRTLTVTATAVDFPEVYGMAIARVIGTQEADIPVAGVSIAGGNFSLTAGNTLTLTATVSPANATNRNVTWESSNVNVATVSAGGLVHAVSPGTATITVRTVDCGFSASVTITVSAQQGAGGNGGSGDDGGTAPTPTPQPTPTPTPAPTPTPPERITIDGIEILVEIEDGVATLEISEDDIADIIEEAEYIVTIDLSDFEDVTSAILPADAWVGFGEAELGLEIIMYEGTLTFDANAVLSVGEFADGADIVSTIESVGITELTAAQQAVVRPGDVVLRITVAADGEYISNLGGVLAVTIPYDGDLPVIVWRVNAEGNLELLESVYNGDGTVTFFTSRLSVFVIGVDVLAVAAATAPLHTMRLSVGSMLFTLYGFSMLSDVAPFIDSAYNRIMVPMRVVAEGLGASVEWDGLTQTVSIRHGWAEFHLVVNESLPDGMGVAVIIDDRVFVPLRFVSEMLGASYVRWDGTNQAAYIYN